MDPILVPAPPRSAYNHNRRVSDLLLSQLKHFQHVERKRGDLGIDPEIARNIHTEGGAALYIAAMTNALRSKGLAKAAEVPGLAVVPAKKAAKKAPQPIKLDLAASADATALPKKSPAKKAAKKAGVKAKGKAAKGKK